MNKKKKDGSALILVILFSMLFIIISGVSALAVVNTFKGNGAEQRYQTLYYEAEAGIEKAIGHANNNDYSADTFTEEDYTFSMSEGDVTLNVKKINDPVYGEYLLATSISTSRRNSNISRTVKAKLRPNLFSSDLFKYSLCGTAVTVESGGTFNMSQSLINSSNVTSILNGSNPIGPLEENAIFQLPIFKVIKKDAHGNDIIGPDGKPVMEDSISYKDDDLTISVTDTIEAALGESSDYIKKIPYTTVPIPSISAGGAEFTVYLVNAKNLIINAPIGSADENIMIISSGSVEITTSGNVQLNGGSIVGDKVKVSRGNMQINNPPFDAAFPNRNGGHSPLASIDIENLLNRISDYAPNLSSSGGGAGGNSSNLPFDYE